MINYDDIDYKKKKIQEYINILNIQQNIIDEILHFVEKNINTKLILEQKLLKFKIKEMEQILIELNKEKLKNIEENRKYLSSSESLDNLSDKFNKVSDKLLSTFENKSSSSSSFKCEAFESRTKDFIPCSELDNSSPKVGHKSFKSILTDYDINKVNIPKVKYDPSCVVNEADNCSTDHELENSLSSSSVDNKTISSNKLKKDTVSNQLSINLKNKIKPNETEKNRIILNDQLLSIRQQKNINYEIQEKSSENSSKQQIISSNENKLSNSSSEQILIDQHMAILLDQELNGNK